MTGTGTGTGLGPGAGREPNRRRGYAIAAGAGALVMLLIGGLAYTVLTAGGDDPAPGAAPPVPPAPEVQDWASEQELSDAPMLVFPDAVAQPHALTTATAGPPIVLPPPGRVVGTPFPDSFPATPEGAVAQLAAMTQAGMLGGDPADYARAYDSIKESTDGPPADRALPAQLLTRFRKNAGLPARGPKAGATLTWTPTSALIKGTVGDRFVVACVLGEFVADYRGQSVSAAMGDCQAMRRVETPDGQQWRIARARIPVHAPHTWPGSAEAVAAGYRDIAR